MTMSAPPADSMESPALLAPPTVGVVTSHNLALALAACCVVGGGGGGKKNVSRCVERNVKDVFRRG